MDTVHIGLWLLFMVVVAIALAVDLGMKSHRHRIAPIPIRDAAAWSVVWVLLAVCFGGVIAWGMDPTRAMEYYTAYVVEKSLSVDNMFVFVMIFKFFRIPGGYQHRVLKWGILGAIVMRFVLIFAGVALLKTFHWMLYVFGALLLYTAWKMLHENPEEYRPGENKVLKLFSRWMPVSHDLDEDRFFTTKAGQRAATPLLAALLVVEASDLMFAIDSIPAVLAISNDPFIVYTSNVFAILGLRALYFLISGVLDMFRYLRYGLSFVLAFIGFKMLVIDVWKVPVSLSLAVVGGAIAMSIILSLVIRERRDAPK